MYKGIIFDLDGVICHTDEYHYLAWKKVSDDLGLKFDRKMNNLLRGVSRRESFLIILEENQKKSLDFDIESILETKNKLYVTYLNQMSAKDLSKTVKSTLSSLIESGFKLAIGSSSKNARLILDKLDITKIFQVIVDGNDISKSKPDPEVFVKAQEGLNLDKNLCLVVEDALSGIKAGVAAGIDTVALKLDSKNLATYDISDISNLLDIVEG